MSWVALLVALSAVAIHVKPLRDRIPTAVLRYLAFEPAVIERERVVERPADDGAEPTLEERVDALEVHAQGSNITHRGLREDVSRHANRLDALESADAGLRERIGTVERDVEDLWRISEQNNATTATVDAGFLRTAALLASYDPTFWEADEELDYGEGGAVLYHAPDDYEAALQAFTDRYHHVGSHRALSLIGVCFNDPADAPQAIGAAERVASRTRINRTRIGSSYWLGDHTDWRNEASDD